MGISLSANFNDAINYTILFTLEAEFSPTGHEDDVTANYTFGAYDLTPKEITTFQMLQAKIAVCDYVDKYTFGIWNDKQPRDLELDIPGFSTKFKLYSICYKGCKHPSIYDNKGNRNDI